MNLLFGHDKAVADWVSKQPFCKPFHPPYVAFGVVDETGRLRGGFVFTGYTGDSISLSLAVDHWKWRSREWRSALAAVIDYVFEQRKCVRLEARTADSNKRVKKQLPRLMKYEGPCRRLYGKEGGSQYSLTIDDLPAFREKWKI